MVTSAQLCFLFFIFFFNKQDETSSCSQEANYAVPSLKTPRGFSLTLKPHKSTPLSLISWQRGPAWNQSKAWRLLFYFPRVLLLRGLIPHPRPRANSEDAPFPQTNGQKGLLPAIQTHPLLFGFCAVGINFPKPTSQRLDVVGTLRLREIRPPRPPASPAARLT